MTGPETSAPLSSTRVVLLGLGSALLVAWFAWVSGAFSEQRAEPPVPLAQQPMPEPPAGVAPSIAAVVCAHSLGSGFFVAPNLLVTTAHVLCPDAQAPEVWLAGGRHLTAELVHVDEWLDLAILKVDGAAAPPLHLGDAALLEAGSPAFLFAVRGEGARPARVRVVGRNHLGIALLQFDGPVWPGDSGAPLVDPGGRVVGVVSMMAFDDQGMGLAVPVNYLPDPATSPAASSAQWRAILDAVARSDEEERNGFTSSLERLALVTGRIDEDRKGAQVVVLARTTTGAPPETLEGHLVVRHLRAQCPQVVQISKWEPLLGASPELADSRLLRWVTTHHLERGLFLGRVHLGASCIPKRPSDGLELSLEEGDSRAWRVDLR